LKEKARAKDVSHKPTLNEATEPGKRLFLDTTGPFEMSAGGTKYDTHLVDQAARFGWVIHITKKNQVSVMLDTHLTYLHNHGYAIKYLRCDNAGEHQKKLKKVCDSHGVEMEYTAPNTPQMNGVLERRIAVTARTTYAMLTGAKLNERYRMRLRTEAKTTANKLKNLHVTTTNGKCPAELFFGVKPKLSPECWIEFGRQGYDTDHKKIKQKDKQRGIPMTMVGYDNSNSPDVYRMYNPNTNTVISSRDVKWTNWERSDPTAALKALPRPDRTSAQRGPADRTTALGLC
jgi:transposase InsO family protein